MEMRLLTNERKKRQEHLRDRQVRSSSLNRYIRLAAATKRRIRREAKIEWERAWTTEKTSRPTGK